MSNLYGIHGATELTADDIKSLRGSEDISFHKFEGDSSTTLLLRRTVGKGQFQTVAEVQLSAATRITDYSPIEGPRVERDYVCHSSSVWASAWQTAVSVLKAGDVLLIEWVRGNDSPAMTEAGATADELRLQVIRPGKRPTLTFLLNYSVHAGSGRELSRMVRAPRQQYSLVTG